MSVVQTNLTLVQRDVLGVTAGIMMPEEQNKQGLCSDAAKVTPSGPCQQEASSLRALDTDWSGSLKEEWGLSDDEHRHRGWGGKFFSSGTSLNKGFVTEPHVAEA